MSEIIPSGKNLTSGRWTIEDSSFLTKMAQDILDSQPQQNMGIEGSPVPTEKFPFDAFRISGYDSTFGPNLRYIKNEDKTKAFQIVLND
jgi:hypothetical protein